MFSSLLLLVPLVFAGTEFSFPSFTINDRFTFPINQCFENVTKRESDGYWQNTGSTYCTCTEGKTLTESGFACFYYDEPGCFDEFGDVWEEHWGGCETSGNIKYLHTVEGCDAAKTQLEENDGECGYWIRQTNTYTNQEKIYPLKTCFDYWCEDNNGDEDSRSCEMTCDGGDISQAEYNDYICSPGALQDTDCSFCSEANINNKDCSDGSGCSVTVTRWRVNDARFECGSKSDRNHFKTSTKNLKSNYIMLGNDQTPYPIQQCAQMRYGYYTYSYQYLCSDDGTEVYLYHYLNDDGKCDDSDSNGNKYLIETYVADNTTFKCDGSDSTGKIGYYEECDDYNWDAKYYEYLTLFDECTPLKDNPLTMAADDSILGDQPWYSTLRVVMSCNLNKAGKTYPSVYLYVTEDCSGDYLFAWDWDDYYSQLSNYGVKKCSIPQISGCSNGKDSVQKSNLPYEEYVC